MISVTSKGRVVMQISLEGTADVPATKLRSLMQVLHTYGIGKNLCVRYPQISLEWTVFHPVKGNTMNLEKHLMISEKRAIKNVQPELKTVYVAPTTSTLPDDGVLDYNVVTSVYDLKDVESCSVIQFANVDLSLLKLVADNTAMFGCRLIYLAGLPGADYTVEFDSNTWGLTRAAYTSVVDELLIEKGANERFVEEHATVFDKEKAQYTRADGSVKAQTGFDIATRDDDEGNAADDESAGT